MDFILIAKALHIVGFVSWFAGLFYLGRVLVNHADTENITPLAGDDPTAVRNRLKKRAKHLRKWAKREGISCYRLNR